MRRDHLLSDDTGDQHEQDANDPHNDDLHKTTPAGHRGPPIESKYSSWLEIPVGRSVS